MSQCRNIITQRGNNAVVARSLVLRYMKPRRIALVVRMTRFFGLVASQFIGPGRRFSSVGLCVHDFACRVWRDCGRVEIKGVIRVSLQPRGAHVFRSWRAFTSDLCVWGEIGLKDEATRVRSTSCIVFVFACMLRPT